jgi:hypothetical protein
MLRQKIRIVTTVFDMVGRDNISHKYQTIKANSAASNFLHFCHASCKISRLFTVTSTFRTDLCSVPPYFTVEVVWNGLSRVAFPRLSTASLIFVGEHLVTHPLAPQIYPSPYHHHRDDVTAPPGRPNLRSRLHYSPCQGRRTTKSGQEIWWHWGGGESLVTPKWTWDLNKISAFYKFAISTSWHLSLEDSYPT